VAFETSVFINCPFDADYLPLLRPMLFCVRDLGLEPRIALEALDSGRPRIEKIIALVRSCKFAIHDLSRLKAKKKGEFFRLNMPFELGLDVGCRVFGGAEFADKKCLILETERYRYQAAISDLSNSDIAVHGDEPQVALTEVRNWIVSSAGVHAPGPAALWGRFTDFMTDNYDALVARGFSPPDIERLPVPELLSCIDGWIARSPAR
jgi:hypothetical protein